MCDSGLLFIAIKDMMERLSFQNRETADKAAYQLKVALNVSENTYRELFLFYKHSWLSVGLVTQIMDQH